MKKSQYPKWLHQKLASSCASTLTSSTLQKKLLFTVCEEAKCPNRGYCFSKKRATFLVLGNQCTRSCGFCNIAFSSCPSDVDSTEPERIADTVKDMNLSHVVITMVTRDDLSDGGANHIKQILKKIKESSSKISVEILTSDFDGNFDSLEIALEEKPDIFNHNLETTRRLTSSLRHKAQYERSLSVLQAAKKLNKARYIKSGLMVGLGETKEEVKQTLLDLKNVGVDIITIGQYLQPNPKKRKVEEFVAPSIFQEYENYGKSIGIKYTLSAPFVRSSYLADQILENLSKM